MLSALCKYLFQGLQDLSFQKSNVGHFMAWAEAS